MKIKEDLPYDLSALLKEFKLPVEPPTNKMPISYSIGGIDFSDFRKKLGLPELSATLSGWDQSFSDPSKHQPQSFRYLIHGIQDSLTRAMQHLALIDSLPGEFQPSQHINLLDTPYRIKEKKVISASIIDQNHIDTFGGAGMILSCPAKNVIDISHEDQGTNFANPDAVLNVNRKPLPPLDLILEQTGNGLTNWNEARITGSTDAGDVAIVGYWIKVDERGKPQSPEVAERIRHHAGFQQLPLITFVIESQAFREGPAEIHDNVAKDGSLQPYAVSINKDGLRYFINLEHGEAIVYNRYREGRKMEAHEALALQQAAKVDLQPEKYQLIEERLSQFIATLS